MAIQGLAVDGDGNVFACDRQNKRVLVLDANGKIVRSLNVANPDAVAVHPKTKTLYVTTRFGSYGGQGKLHLLKFADWSKDTDPVQAIPLSETVGKFASFSHVAVALDKDATFVWTAYTTLPARVFREGAAGLELVKDFYQSGPRQRALDMQHMMLDQKTGDAYLADSSGFVFRVRDWNKPQFELCMHDAKTKMVASSIAIDSQQRTLFARYHWGKPVNRWKIDGEFFTPAPGGAAGHAITGKMNCGWDFCGLHERGMAAAPGGGLAVLAGLPDLGHRADDYSGPLHFFKPDPAKAPWTPLHIKTFGDPRPNTAGVRFDPRGNLYVGVKDGQVKNIPKGFANDPDFGNDPWQGSAARIYKFAPTGSGQNGDWFPTAPDGPAKIYEINFGALAPSANFGVDGYGRLYYPTGMLPQVSVIDNEGNRILAFGTYGNRDSMGGLNGDLEPDQDVPLARPSSVDADDDFIYVTDIINVRLLRLAKTFRLEAAAKIQPRLAN
jgi:DNA-binding beta-propeller fold protein YncE